MRHWRVDAIAVVACALALAWVGGSVLAANNGSACTTTITFPGGTPTAQPCDPGTCWGENTECRPTSTASTIHLLGTTATEWSWSSAQGQWVKTGGVYDLSLLGVEATTCACANIDEGGEIVSWNEDAPICCKLVEVENAAGDYKVCTMGSCDEPGCPPGECSVVPATPGGGEHDPVQASCE